MAIRALPRNDDGTLPAYAWPGGYPLIYFDVQGGMLCPKCANTYNFEDDSGLQPVTYDIYWEGPDIACDGCSEMIVSAYGDPDADE